MNNLQKLYKYLLENKMIKVDFDTFNTYMDDESYQQKVYNVISEKGDYTKDFNQFKSIFTPTGSSTIRPDGETTRTTLIERLTEGTPFEWYGKELGDVWYTAPALGFERMKALDSSLQGWAKGSKMTDEEIAQFMKDQEAMMNIGQTRTMIKRDKDYQQLKKKYGGFTAWFFAAGKNPSWLTQASLQSLAQIAGSVAYSGPTRKAVGAAAGTTLLAGFAGPQAGLPEEIFSVPASAFAATSTMMETGLTMSQLMREYLEEQNKEWNVENVKELFRDESAIKKIRNRAIKRGVAIGIVDYFTGTLAKNVGSTGKLLNKQIARTTRQKVGGSIGVGVGGGLTSEVAGQIAGEQDLNIDEILTEGFTEIGGPQTMLGVVSAIRKPASYEIGGTKMDVKQFEDEMRDIDDATFLELYTRGDIKVENDQLAQNLVNAKIKHLQGDLNLDSKINNTADRAAAINLEIEIAKLEANKKPSESIKQRIKALKSQLKEITDKYIDNDVDVTIEQRKAAILEARKKGIKGKITREAAKARKAGEDITLLNEESFNKLIGENPDAEITIDGVNIDGKKYINVDKAANIAVVSHEILHDSVDGTFASLTTEAQSKLLTDLFDLLGEDNAKVVIDALEADGIKADSTQGVVSQLMDKNLGVEVFTKLSDAIRTNKIEYNESFAGKLKNLIEEILRKLSELGVIREDGNLAKLHRKEFGNARQAFNFLRDYSATFEKKGVASKRAKALAAKFPKTGISKSMTTEQRTKAENEIKKLGTEGLLGDNFRQKGGKFLFDAEFNDIYNKIKSEGYLDNLIASKFKGDTAPKSFVDKVYSELTAHAKRFNPEQNNDFFGYLNSQIANKAGNVYNREYKADKTTAGRARDIGETTQEGEIKVQVAADKDTALEALETEDLSVAGQARAKAQKTERQSKLRRQLGFETGSKMYKSVLESGRKSLLIAYRKTQSIKDPAKRARAIKDLLRKEYFTKGLTSDLFKSVKNFLGTKEYINNLKQYREAIVEALSTADLVQIERKVPDSDRIFTVFDKKLTKIQDVEAAVQKGLLPTEAINAIQKGQAVNLYKKRMPTESELVEFADQPAINPVTGQRSGLKGTRKDGFAKAIANTMVLDAVMEVRQSESVIEALQDDAIAQLDLMALSDAVGREVDVKFSKSTAVADINNAIDNNINLSVYSQIKFSRSHRDAYEARLTKKRTDLDEKQIKSAVESIFKFVEGENILNNKKAKYEKMAMHYMVNGNLILPEDGYKVIEAERIAAIKKIDPFSYKNPTTLIEKFAGEVKGARINPDTVQEFTNKTNVGQGVTVYDVEDSKEGQRAVRKVIDTHFGKKANPWCLCARTGEYYGSDQAYSVQERDQMVADQEAEGRSVQVYEYREDGQTIYELTITEKPDINNELKESFVHWKNYNKQGNGYKIAFKNGKLLCFRDGNKQQWWNRNDEASDKIHFTVTEKKGNVESIYDVTPEDGAKILTRRTKGKMPTAEVYTRNEDNNYIYESDVNYVDGRAESIRLETIYKDKRLSQGVGVYFGVNPDIQFNNITKHVQTIKNNVKTSVYEGKVILTSKQFKHFENKTVEIKHVVNAQNNENISLTINGIEQNIDAKFSKSAAEVNYNKSLNNIKFSLTPRETKRKLQPYLAKRINDVEELGFTTDKIMYSTLQEETERGVELKDAYAVAINKAFSGQANEIINMDENTVLDLEGLDVLENNIKEFYLPKIRVLAKNIALKKYAKLIKATTDINDKLDLINSFLINYGRPIRSGKVLNITTNRALLAEMKKAFGSIMNNYSLKKVQGGEKVMLNGKDIDLYQSITPIKLDPAKYKETINKQAKKAKDFLFDDILGYDLIKKRFYDNGLSNGQKKSLVQLIFYGQKGPGRKLYKLGTYVENKRAAETTLEHEITADDMHGAIIDVIDGKKDINELSNIIDNAYVHVLPKEINNIFKKLGKTSNRNLEGYNSMPEVLEYLGKLELQNNSLFNFSKSKPAVTIHNAIMKSKSVKDVKGITILDFDDTLATSKSLIRFTRPDGSQGTLTPEQYASTYEDLLDLGYKFDFSEFNKVVDGKPAPLLNKAKKLAGKFGTKDMFVLTARPSASAKAIREFLKQNGLDIPLKNITGLGNSTAEAKALWVADKVADGYNDFYFADDALKNVQAVQNMLDQFDVKSKVQQARIKFSKSKKQVFDSIIKRTVGADKEIDAARARIIGADKGKREFFIAPGADDFQGLMFRLAGKGRKGEADKKFFKRVFFDPFNRAYRKLNGIQYNMMESYAQIRKDHKDVVKKLKKKFDSEFTNEDAIRIYLWNLQDIEVPGLTNKQRKAIAAEVAKDADMVEYALKVRKALQIEGDQYLAPTESWMAGSIKGDMYNSLNKVHRDNALQEWQENVDELLNNEAQLAKLEAAMGTDYIESLKDILYRMKTGRNRPTGQNAATNKVLNWLQGSVGAIMFFNMRSAVLQTISTVNFINHTDNNIFAFAKAIANVKQFAEDFKMLFNSPQLKVRRSGLQQDIQTADLADSLSRGGAASNALAYLLKIGFTPTQIADSFAIAFGGATFYRNRVNSLIKQGMTKEQAESQAMIDFQDITEESQQSSRPDRISKQQASVLGRLLLAFQNTPLQYNRIIKKAISDIANNRGDKKTHISRIAYYGAIQSLIFYSLQQALFAEDEPEEEQVPNSIKKEYAAKIKDGSLSKVIYPNAGYYYKEVKNAQKKEGLVNSMADGWLRGSGIKGAIVSTFKNVVRSFMKESKKGYQADYFNTFVEILNVSPQIGSKARKIKRATDTYKYNKDVMSEIGAFDIDNPVYPMTTSLIEGATNAPVHRIYTKLDNLKEAFNEDNTAMQRLFVALGWNQWQLGIDTYKDVREAKEKIKEEEKAKKKQCRKRLSNGKRCKIMTTNKSQYCYHHD